MQPVALVTDAAHPELAEDDRLLLPALARTGLRGTPVRWDDPAAPWNDFAAVVVRSPWDYFRRWPEFEAWLDRVDREARVFLNPMATVRWNADKHYLRDLTERGVESLPTEFIEPPPRGERSARLTELLAQRGWDEAVLKPAVSAGADRTLRFRASDVARAQPLLEQLLSAGVPALLQPYRPEVEQEGEWSLLFFDRVFSHAVLKRPAPGDFRVQPTFGGVVEARDPPSEVLAAGQSALDAIPGPLLYARVDGLRLEGRFTLVEVELIEPALYFAQAPEAPVRFAEALRAMVDRGHG